jgi:hypothetical protein
MGCANSAKYVGTNNNAAAVLHNKTIKVDISFH